MHDPLHLTTLYRPTGEAELRLVIERGFFAWPDRLPEQPIFYPVTNEDYAVQIARDWNTTAQHHCEPDDSRDIAYKDAAGTGRHAVGTSSRHGLRLGSGA